MVHVVREAQSMGTKYERHFAPARFVSWQKIHATLLLMSSCLTVGQQKEKTYAYYSTR
jgi:hypothetical protein